MPGTFSNVLLHLVFSTKGRAELIDAELQQRLYPFIGGIVRDEGGVLMEIGGMPDHVHLLVRWKTDDSIASLLRNVKGRSSKWVNDERLCPGRFSWQEAYSVFSVSASQVEKVSAYIRNQAEHHRSRGFDTEIVGMLRAHGVEFDERYVLG